MKIAIIGNSGSGKSALAFKLHDLLNIPLYHLDQYYWHTGWQRPDRDLFAKAHHELCNRDEWIIEGMAVRYFDYRAKRADCIIFLDMPLWLCIYRIFKRSIINFGKVRESSAEGCPERMPTCEFLSYVWNFNRKQKLVVQALLQNYKNKKNIFVVKNRSELGYIIKKIELQNVKSL